MSQFQYDAKGALVVRLGGAAEHAELMSGIARVVQYQMSGRDDLPQPVMDANHVLLSLLLDLLPDENQLKRGVCPD